VAYIYRIMETFAGLNHGPPKALAIPDPAQPPRSGQTTGGQAAELAVPLALLAIVLAMVAPLAGFPAGHPDRHNITLSVVVLLVAIYILRPVGIPADVSDYTLLVRRPCLPPRG